MSLRTVIAPFMLALLSMTTGCNGSSDSSGSAAPFAISVQTQDANGAESNDFASGQQITIVMTAKNVSDQPQTFNIQGCFGAAAYAVSKHGGSDTVAGGYMQQGVECEHVTKGGDPTTLAPGQSVTARINWTQGVAGGQLASPGSYSVVAGIACVQSEACMPASSPSTGAVPLHVSTIDASSIYRSAAANFTIKP